MGGVGTALRGNSSIYFTNPASYSSLDSNSFVFDFGVDYGRNFISEGTSKYSSTDLNFNHLIMGFPLTKGWGVALGIVPISSGYYKLTDDITTTSPSYDPNIGEYEIDHNGDGGITKLFVGTGIKLTKNFSIGANIAFLSGQLSRTNQFIFADYTKVYNNSSEEKYELHGINFDYGLQYTAALKKNYFLNIGASVSSSSNYKSKYSQLSLRFTPFDISDTISYTNNNNAKTFIPQTLRFGVAFGKKNKFTTAVDYVISNWATSKIPGSTGYAANTRSILFGAEYIPDKYSNYSYIDRMEYRLGGHIEDNYLIINGEQIKEYGASFGVGLPLSKLTSSVANIYIDYTRQTGSSVNMLHNENILTIGASLNLYDFWFTKRKYD
jgi:hypothetical protein